MTTLPHLLIIAAQPTADQLRSVLDAHGYAVSIATTPALALTWLTTATDLPDLLLCAERHPAMPGHMLLQQIAALPCCGNLPAILMIDNPHDQPKSSPNCIFLIRQPLRDLAALLELIDLSLTP